MPVATAARRLVVTWAASRAARAGGRVAARGADRSARWVMEHVSAPIGLSAVFTGAGALHFARPDFFEAIVPDWFPDAELANRASGAAELIFGVLVLPRRTRRTALLGLAVVTVIVFPANVDMALNDVEVRLEDGRFVRSVGTAGTAERAVNWARLPLQLPLLWWLLREARRA